MRAAAQSSSPDRGVIYEGRADVKSSRHRPRRSAPRHQMAVCASHLFGREPIVEMRRAGASISLRAVPSGEAMTHSERACADMP
jgi:hypothetical protein